MESLLIDWKIRLERHTLEPAERLASRERGIQQNITDILVGRIREIRRCIEELEEVMKSAL